MPNWTDAQRQAIEARNNETLVSAAAGSGKTAVLVEHVLQMLRDGGNINRLLIITFTRAAAAELRERLTNAISNETANNKHMRMQLRAARHAQISTLHVFCHHIIREHFQAADVDPMAKIADETTLHPLFMRAIDDAMEELCASEEKDAKALISQYGDDQIVEMAKQLYYFLQAQADPQGFLHNIMSDPLGEGLKPFLLILKKEALMRLEGALQLNEQCKALLDRPNAPKYLQSTAENDRIVLELLQQEMRKPEPGQSELHFSQKARAPKNAEYDPTLAEHFGKLRDRMKDLATEASIMVPRDMEEAKNEIEYTLPALRALIALTKDIQSRYAEMKEARDLLDYNDLEHRALLALSDERIRLQVSSAYDAIFVDEYQDVSAIQEAIVRCVHNGNNRLFMVGDVKQSIYRFRLADPSLFLAKYNQFEEKSDAAARKILLSSNFRSRGNVLAAVNCVFERAMRRGATEIDYDEAAQLRAGIPTEGDPPVELHLIDESLDEENDKDEEDTRKGWMYEAQLAAQRIRALIGTPIRCKEGMRPLRYRDCVILLRNASGRAAQIAKILANEGVPAYSDADAQFFELPEVRDMLNLLRVIDNPYQDVPLMATLRCPYFGFTSERLANIRLKDETLSKPFWQVFFDLRECDPEIAKVCDKLDLWRFWAGHMSVEELIWHILYDTGLYARAGALRDGSMRQANLRLLCERAQAPGVRYSLHDFLIYGETARQTGDSLAAHELSENDDVVRIMTIHKSKGLEFPVVILMELARPFRMPGDSELLRCDAACGLAIKRRDVDERITGHTICGKALEYKRRREICAEEARLLYVAMTRAQERLILLASPRSLTTARSVWELPEGDYAAGCARCMLDWVGQALKEPLLIGQDGLYIASNGSQWVLQSHSAGSFAQQLPKETTFTLPPANNDLVDNPFYSPEQPKRRFFKLSVTSILRGAALQIDEEETVETKRHALNLDTLPPREPAYKRAEQSKAAKRGTATHKALSMLDFFRPIEPQLEEMLKLGVLSEEDRELIRPRDLTSFVDSSLGQRVRNARDVRREWGFKLLDGELIVQGIIDLCFVEDDHWVLVDYKTDRCAAADLPGKYGEQIRWYARALREITEYPVAECWLYGLYEGAAVPVEI